MTGASESHDLTQYTQPTAFIDSDHPDVMRYAADVTKNVSGIRESVVALFHAVRDDIRYDPYSIDLRPESMCASETIARGFGFCIPKAVLLAATARTLGVPSRLGFADVKNHLNTERLKALMKTDVFAFHGYAELWLDGQWVKATPAFNKSLCERFDVAPLDFDGTNDALLQQSNRSGERYMEYLNDYGQFADLPYELMMETWKRHYPDLMAGAGGYTLPGDFEADAGSIQQPSD